MTAAEPFWNTVVPPSDSTSSMGTTYPASIILANQSMVAAKRASS